MNTNTIAAKRERRLLAALGLGIIAVVLICTVCLIGPSGAVTASTSGGYVTFTAGCFARVSGGGVINFNFYDLPLTSSVTFTIDVAGYPSSGYQPLSITANPSTFADQGWTSPGNYTVSTTWVSSDGQHGTAGPTTVTVPNCTGNGGTSGPPSNNGGSGYVAMAAMPTGNGYWTVTSGGRINAYGNAPFFGDSAQVNTAFPSSPSNSFTPNQPIVGIAPSYDSSGNVNGYWLDASDGGIFAFGGAQFYGSMGGHPLNQPMVGMATTPDGHGYWTVAADGGIFSFGDAQFYGSTGAMTLNKPVVGMAGDLATGGYWLVASDGGIFSFNAPFQGSTGNIVLNKPIVQMEAASDGSGYRFVASDGGVFCFNEPFAGSLGGTGVTNAVGMAPYGVNGYWVLRATGAVSGFGGAPVL